MPTNAPAIQPAETILTHAEAASRLALLAELQTRLAELGARCVLARTRRLVLRSGKTTAEPSGPTDPRLYVITPAGTPAITTDGTAYNLATGQRYAASDPHAAAARIYRSRSATRP